MAKLTAIFASLLILGALAAQSAFAEDSSAKAESIKVALSTTTGPRVAAPGERYVRNNTPIPLTFRYLAEVSVSDFNGKCSADEILSASGWSDVADTVMPRKVKYFVACKALSV